MPRGIGTQVNAIPKIGAEAVASAAAETEWTWNSADKGAAVVLSESDKLATFTGATGVSQGVRGPAIVGLRYFALQSVVHVATQRLGVANGSYALNELASGTTGIAMYEDDIYYNGSAVVSNVGVNLSSLPSIMFAVNANNGRVWVGNYSTGSWFNSGDPAAGTGYVGTLTGTLYPAASCSDGSPDGAVRVLSYAVPPTGFSRL